MDERSTVLVTVHGIGFQREGYADQLHAHLRTQLGSALGDDPERDDGGPVYVRSEWEGSRDKGLARLVPGRPLVKVPGTIAHVALVYSPSEPLDPRLGSVADAIARAALAHGHYTTVLGALRLVFGDAWAALHETTGGTEATSSLVPRSDPPVQHASHGWLHKLLHGHAAPAAPLPPPDPGALGMLRALEDDVATYVARNDLRERVRGFVQAALLMLYDRAGDVGALVVNGHSQGTVLTWDVLCRLPLFSWQATDERRAGLLRHYVTAGSPIRKYVDMFAWGDQVGQLAAIFDGRPGAPGWSNFWDARDPVADPLDPPTAWHFGERPDMPRPDGDLGLLLRRDPAGGPSRHVTISDVEVDNIHNSAGGGLQAHDYWNNQAQFVAPLAQILRGAAA